MAGHSIVVHGPSRSFQDGDPFLEQAVSRGTVEVHLGVGARQEVPESDGFACTLIELDLECLGVHTGESGGREGDRRVGFCRWQVGDRDPSGLIELVTQPGTHPDALAAARGLFVNCGLTTSVCRDAAGRILDRLLRPYFNDALRGLDQGLASAADLDKTVRLGLGYPEGPIALLERVGMVRQHDASRALFEAHGLRSFAPARRAIVASERRR